MPFSLTPDLFQHPHVALNHKKSPGGQEGETTGGNEGVYDEQPILFISHKNERARLRG